MPTLDYDELLERLAGGKARQKVDIEELAREAPPGFLATLGRILDTPGRYIRSTLAGREDATGRDVLGLGHNEPGLDFGDVAGFATELVTDPLSYLGGIGAFTKIGKTATALGRVRHLAKDTRGVLKAARLAGDTVGEASEIAKRASYLKDIKSHKAVMKAAGAPIRYENPIPKTWGEQGSQGFRQLLGVDVPFTGIRGKIPVHGEGRVLNALQRTGNTLSKLPGVEGINRLFNSRAGRLEATRPHYEKNAQDLREAALNFVPEYEKDTVRIAGIANRLGIPVEQADNMVLDLAQTFGVQANSGRMAAEILSKAKNESEALRLIVGEKNKFYRSDSAAKALKTAEGRYASQSARANELGKLRIPSRVGRLGDLAEQISDTAGTKVEGILTTPTPERVLGKITARQEKEFSRFFDWTQSLLRRMGISEDKLSRYLGKTKEWTTGEGFGKFSDSALKAKAANESLADLDRIMANVQRKGPESITQIERDILAEYEGVLQGRAGSVLTDAGYRREAVERGARELNRLGVDKRISRLQTKSLDQLVSARQRASDIEKLPLAPRQDLKLQQRMDLIMSSARAEADPFIQAGRGASATQKFADPEVFRLAQEAWKSGSNIQAFERAAGNISPTLKSDQVGYMRALLSPQARAAMPKETFTPPGAIGHPTQTGVEQRRILPHQDKPIGDINREAVAAGNVAPFIEKPALLKSYRNYEGRVKIANANLATGLVKGFSKHGGDGMPVNEFFERAGVTFRGDKARTIPREIADEFLKVTQKLGTPEEVMGLKGAWESMNAWTRASFTSIFPSFHGRNFFSNTIQSWLAGALNPTLFPQALRIYRDPTARREMERLGILGGGFSRSLTGGRAQQIFKEHVFGGQATGLARFKRPETAPIVGGAYRKGSEVGEAVEGVSRIQHYLAERAKGMSEMDAVASVRKHLFDYNDLTDFEKKYLKPMVFFYGFTRKALPQMLKAFVETPSRQAMAFRAITQPTVERGPMPAWLREGVNLPAGQDRQGNPQFFSGIGVPQEELAKLDIFTGARPGAFGVAQRALEKGAMQLVPQLRAPIEMTADRDFFLQRPIAEADKAPAFAKFLPGFSEVKFKGGGTGYRADPHVLYALRNSPLAAIFNKVGKATDERKDLGERIMQALTGTRFTSIEPEREAERMAMEVIRRRLGELQVEGKTGKLDEYFAKLQADGQKDPEAMMLLKMLRQIRK